MRTDGILEQIVPDNEESQLVYGFMEPYGNP